MRSKGRRTWKRTAIGVCAALILVLGALPGDAVVSERPVRTWGVSGRVYAVLQVGGRIYVGGDFSSAVAPDGTMLSRPDLVALDAATGTLDPDFRPQATGQVRALAASADGSILYVGGGFSSMGGASRRNLAAINPSTGAAVTAWRADANGRVNSLAGANGRVYAGGWFTSVTDSAGKYTRSALVAVAQSNGRVDTDWRPSATDAPEDYPVRALALSPDRSKVYLGGNFLAVNGQERRHLAKVDAITGALDGTFKPFAPEVYDIDLDTERVYLALGGAGGEGRAVDPVTGATRWSKRGDGDTQGVAVFGDAVYIGGHFDNFDGVTRKKLVALNPTTGSLFSFAPVINSALGVFGVTAGNGCLLIGGDFTAISGVAQRHVAKFV